MVRVERLTHRYGERIALAEVSFSVGQGEIFGLLGPNGGGKSTLFRILSTLQAPNEGTATVAGFDVRQQPDEVRRRIGVVFQSQSLDKKLTVDENLVAQGHMYGLSGARLRERIALVAERLGLGQRRADIVETLSGGLRRRAEIAKGLLHEPQVLLMDEASTGLDPRARRELWEYVNELRTRDGLTVVLTSHILDEADRCDRLLLLHEGRVVGEGSPGELKARIGGDVVVLEAADTDSFATRIAQRFPVQPKTVDGEVRIEVPAGHRFISELFEAFPGEIQAISLHKPTLEDVFVRETGAPLC
ncbi:MAG: ATP-binding cassette domain-containing protein [Bryobacterales bacterium]|nr:ATP-binding cassette domain-containing protein [Bryobacterales bacterium]